MDSKFKEHLQNTESQDLSRERILHSALLANVALVPVSPLLEEVYSLASHRKALEAKAGSASLQAVASGAVNIAEKRAAVKTQRINDNIALGREIQDQIQTYATKLEILLHKISDDRMEPSELNTDPYIIHYNQGNKSKTVTIPSHAELAVTTTTLFLLTLEREPEILDLIKDGENGEPESTPELMDAIERIVKIDKKDPEFAKLYAELAKSIPALTETETQEASTFENKLHNFIQTILVDMINRDFGNDNPFQTKSDFSEQDAKNPDFLIQFERAYFMSFALATINHGKTLDILTPGRQNPSTKERNGAKQDSVFLNSLYGTWSKKQNQWDKKLAKLALGETETESINSTATPYRGNKRSAVLPSELQILIEFLALNEVMTDEEKTEFVNNIAKGTELVENRFATQPKAKKERYEAVVASTSATKSALDLLTEVKERPEFIAARNEMAQDFPKIAKRYGIEEEKPKFDEPETPQSKPKTKPDAPQSDKNSRMILDTFNKELSFLSEQFRNLSLVKLEEFCMGENKRHIQKLSGWSSTQISVEEVVDFANSFNGVEDIKTLDRLMLIADAFNFTQPRTAESFGKTGLLSSKADFVKLGVLAVTIQEAKGQGVKINDASLYHFASELGLGDEFLGKLNSQDESEISRMNDRCYNVGLALRGNISETAERIERASTTLDVGTRRVCISGMTHRVGVGDLSIR